MRSNTFKIEIGDVKMSVILNGVSFGTIRNSNFSDDVEKSMQTHGHSSYEIMAIMDGNVVINTFSEGRAHSDEVVIIPPYLQHCCVYNNVSAAIFNFTIEKLENGGEKIFDVVKSAMDSGIVSLKLDKSARFYAGEFCEKFADGFASEAVSHLISLLFIEIFSHFVKNAPKGEVAPSDSYITLIDCFITANLDKAITLENMAEQLHVCAKQVSRIIKKEYGCTLVELVNRRRTGVAAMLLLNTGLKTQEIALSVGYATEKSFRNNFKNLYGVTPSEYRIAKGLVR